MFYPFHPIQTQRVISPSKGGVAVWFRDDRKVLPWNGKEETIMVVMDREKKVVEDEDEDGYYLVVSESVMNLERGSVSKDRKVEESLGMVVLVVRPHRDEDVWQRSGEIGIRRIIY